MRFLKYEIPKERWLNEFQPLLQDKSCHTSIIGELVEGMTAIDILWEDEPLEIFDEFKVFPREVGKHTFLGLEHLYKQEFENQ